MILVDNNQIVFANIFQMVKHNRVDNIDLLRHLILNTYRMYRSKFGKEYGELVICHDSGNVWRKQHFPYYKASRRVAQEQSDMDWDIIYDMTSQLRREFKETFPYKNLKVDCAEADDIIAVITKHYHQQEKILILSGDKDFQQLQVFPNVHQYAPTKKSFLKCEDPKKFLLDHIIKGDSSDGIPNILSDDDTFVCQDKRQKPCGKKKIEGLRATYLEGEMFDHNLQRNWERNETLVDLTKIPDDLEDSILNEYNTEPVGSRSKIYPYCVENSLGKLLPNIDDF
tara:strand:- start:1851 stop:2699 length:849 start_codon:yes stop_codon:yes gene_type:complete